MLGKLNCVDGIHSSKVDVWNIVLNCCLCTSLFLVIVLSLVIWLFLCFGFLMRGVLLIVDAFRYSTVSAMFGANVVVVGTLP